MIVLSTCASSSSSPVTSALYYPILCWIVMCWPVRPCLLFCPYSVSGPIRPGEKTMLYFIQLSDWSEQSSRVGNSVVICNTVLFENLFDDRVNVWWSLSIALTLTVCQCFRESVSYIVYYYSAFLSISQCISQTAKDRL